MLTIKQIRQYYPKKLQAFEQSILREYLQYKILEGIYESKFSNSLIFLGGTALRVIYGNQRFSEDLDFDNINLTEADFESITTIIEKHLEKEGFEVEFRVAYKGAFHCYIKFPGLLYKQGLSKQKREKILIRLDTVPQKFNYQPDKKILKSFDVFTQIFAVPIDILAAQKIYALLDRKRAKGRDYFDTVFLLSITKPNYNYLSKKIKVSNLKELKTALLSQCQKVDLHQLARDVEPFLFKPQQKKQVALFEDYVKELK